MRVWRLTLLVVAACGAPPGRPVAGSGHALTLHRDRALIVQDVGIEVPASGRTEVHVRIAAAVDAHEVAIVDRGAVKIGEMHTAQPAGDQPTALTFVATGRAGRHSIRIAYVSDRIAWDAAYTITTSRARDRGTLRGALAIRNRTGIAFDDARISVVDAELGAWGTRLAERIGSEVSGTPASTTPIATPRALGRANVGLGETRIELLAGEPERSLRSVLVYDPIGTGLDTKGAEPIRDSRFGMQERASSRVTESIEIERTTSGLPGGPVRVLERAADGSLALLGESRLFDSSSQIAERDTIAIGVAQGVTGSRERREITVDPDTKRLVEEFVISIANTRSRPVDVIVREHMYRGQNWTLAFRTAPDATKEGPQQIALRTSVPANSKAQVLYVVVYTWR